MNRSSLFALVLAAAAAGGYAYYAQRGEADPAVPPATSPRPAAPPQASASPATAPLVLPTAETSEAKAQGYIAYPDGTFYPPLNGVKVAPKIPFHARLAPFTKVVGKERDNTGREWYVHENGLRSTTYVNGKGVSTYEVVKPMEPQPILPEELPGGTGR